MPSTTLLSIFTPAIRQQGQQSGWIQALQAMLREPLEVGTMLFAFILAIFVLLVFAVRVLAVVRKLPIPVDPIDMAKPTGFRAVMLAAAAVLAPLAAYGFLPVQGPDLASTLMAAYLLEIPIVLVLWIALHLLYTVRASRKRSKP